MSANTITPEELALIATLKSLPALPVVVAGSMLYAQGVKLTSEERANIKERQRVFLALGLPGTVNLRVEDHAGARLGSLQFDPR